jgi:uncharacterized protein (UPF0335 family)
MVNVHAEYWKTINDLSRDKKELFERIKRLEENLMDMKNKHAALVADVVLYEDRGERIKRLESVTNDPHALWANWLRGTVTLPVGIGDVRQYQERIKRLEEALRRIASTDYRGNRSTESQMAAEALKP